MFRKEFRTKSNCQLKNSERKQFKTLLLDNFPVLTEGELDFIFASKEPIFQAKIITHSNETMYIYHTQNTPMAFKIDTVIYPTVYFMWECPNAVPSMITHAFVLEKLRSGADLMTPGVIPFGLPGVCQYGTIEKNKIVVVNDVKNIAAQAVGITTMSSHEMYMSGGKGKCVKVLHTIGDNLYLMKTHPPKQIPDLGPPQVCNKEILEEDDTPEETPVFTPSDLSRKNSVENEETEENKNKTEIGDVEKSDDQTETSDDEKINKVASILSSINLSYFEDLSQLIKSPMDELFIYSFLKELKYPNKPHTFPILTSHFSKLILSCPNGNEMDIKKSSFKKFSNFYTNMAKLGVIEYGQKTKGVDSILSVKKSHRLLSAFKINENITPEEDKPKEEVKKPVVIEETFFVNSAVNSLFKYTNVKKSVVVTTAFVRDTIKEYVLKEKLYDPDNPRTIIPNKEIKNAVKINNSTDLGSLIEQVFLFMGHSYRLVKCDGTVIVGTCELKTIDVSTVIRSGKKITIIENLLLYGINLEEFSKDLQHGVAASTTINKIKDKTTVVTVQGSHYKFISKLLNEKYGIPVRYVKNLTPKKDNKK